MRKDTQTLAKGKAFAPFFRPMAESHAPSESRFLDPFAMSVFRPRGRGVPFLSFGHDVLSREIMISFSLKYGSIFERNDGIFIKEVPVRCSAAPITNLRSSLHFARKVLANHFFFCTFAATNFPQKNTLLL